MDIPLIRKFQGGYEQGALYVNPDIEIHANMTGTTPEAWNNPTKGAELTKAQIDKGADVVYQAAGGTGIGVLQAAADAGILGIGVDTNQNWMHPGNMLTSMLKRLDLTIFEQAEKTVAGTFEPGINIKGKVTVLSEGCRGHLGKEALKKFNLDKNNKSPQQYGIGFKEIWEISMPCCVTMFAKQAPH